MEHNKIMLNKYICEYRNSSKIPKKLNACLSSTAAQSVCEFEQDSIKAEIQQYGCEQHSNGCLKK